MEFNIKVKFLDKGSSNIKVECRDGFTAIQKAMSTLNATEKDNIKAVLIK